MYKTSSTTSTVYPRRSSAACWACSVSWVSGCSSVRSSAYRLTCRSSRRGGGRPWSSTMRAVSRSASGAPRRRTPITATSRAPLSRLAACLAMASTTAASACVSYRVVRSPGVAVMVSGPGGTAPLVRSSERCRACRCGEDSGTAWWLSCTKRWGTLKQRTTVGRAVGDVNPDDGRGLPSGGDSCTVGNWSAKPGHACPFRRSS